MIKKFFFIALIISLVSCTNFVYNSFAKARESMWKKSISEQKNFNQNPETVVQDGPSAVYRRPSFLVSSETSLFVFYERRDRTNTGEIGVDGTRVVNIYYRKSEGGVSFGSERIIGKEATQPMNSHGSPISFLANNKYLVLLSSSGAGFGSNDNIGNSKISMSRSGENGLSWSEWVDIPDSVFDEIRRKGYNRFYTTSGNGLTLNDREGTLVCTIDFATNTSVNSPSGFAILYSKNDGTADSWKVGGIYETYNGHRNAKILAQTSDGNLLIGATSTNNGTIKWFKASSVASTPTEFSDGVSIQNNGGKIEGYRLTAKESGHSKDRIIFAYTKVTNSTSSYTNLLQVSISEDEGKSFSWTTNLQGAGSASSYLVTSYYPTIRVLADGTIAMFNEESIGQYSITDMKLVYRRFSVNWLTGGKEDYSSTW